MSHAKGSRRRLLFSSDILKAFNGDIFRVEISGSKANRREMINPSTRPWNIAGHEILTVISKGRKSLNTTGKIRCIKTPSVAPINEPINPIAVIWTR